MRKPIVAANWKMNATRREAETLAREVLAGVERIAGAEVVVCPPYTALETVAAVLQGSAVRLGAQNLHGEPRGAFTGEVSATMLRDVGCEWVIIGHSERRTLFGETDADVRRKTDAALRAGLHPIVCVGETLEQREAERTEAVLRQQLERGLGGLGESLQSAVVAYEPVWAIGTGRTATPEQTQAAQAFIRGVIGEIAGERVASGLRVQYGGSVKPSNAARLFALPDVDGGLIGGASLEARSFVDIVLAAVRPTG